MSFELAQVNVSRLLAPLDSPLLADFVAALDEVNAAGDPHRASSGGCRPRTATPPPSAHSVGTSAGATALSSI
jgi:Domain of unknown function (DUF3291)